MEQENQLDVMARPGDPEISELIQEFKRAEGYNEIRTRTKESDYLRFDFWTGQSEDGRKWKENYGKEVFPWEGSSDTRTRFIDTLCRFLTNIMSNSFQQAQIMPAGGPENNKDAEFARKYMHWLLFSWLYPELADEIELHASYATQYGWSVVHVAWDRQYSLEPREVNLEMLEGILVEAGQMIPGVDSVVALIDEQEEYLASMLEAQSGISSKEAKGKLRELKDTGSTTFPMRVKCKDDPYLVALRPYYEVLFPAETESLQRARVIFRRDFVNQATLRQRAADENWDEDWVDEVIKRSRRRPYNQDDFSPVHGGSWGNQIDSDENSVEIVYAYRRTVQEDGTSGIYMTVFCPDADRDQHGEFIFAKHELVPGIGDKYPFREFRMENVRRNITDSRGVPHIARTWSYEIKAQFDSVVDRTSFDVLPPIKTPLRYDRVELGPAAQIPEMRPGDVTFLEPPRREPTLAFMVMEALNERADRYYGRPNPKVDPSETMMAQQTFVNRWLSHLGGVFQLMWDHVEAFGDDQRFMEVTGSDSPIPRDPLNSRFWLHFDVTRLNPELMGKKLEAISNFILPEDMAGVVDRNKLVQYKMAAIDPGLAQTALMTEGQASKKLVDDVKTNLAQMFLGNAPDLVELDPSAGVKLQVAEGLIKANPKYQKAMAEDPQFQQLLDAYLKNLHMSVTQEQNKQVGRTGVNVGSIG